MNSDGDIYDKEGWIESAEQADDTLTAIKHALIALAKSSERIAVAAERIVDNLDEQNK